MAASDFGQLAFPKYNAALKERGFAGLVLEPGGPDRARHLEGEVIGDWRGTC